MLASVVELAAISAPEGVAVTADGNRVVLDFPHLQSVLEMWKPLGSASKRRASLDKIQETLERIGIAVELRVQGKSLGGFGPGEHSGLIQRLIA